MRRSGARHCPDLDDVGLHCRAGGDRRCAPCLALAVAILKALALRRTRFGDWASQVTPPRSYHREGSSSLACDFVLARSRPASLSSPFRSSASTPMLEPWTAMGSAGPW